MNITFLLILILWLSFAFFFKNVFNIDVRGRQGYLWSGLIICLFAASGLLLRTFAAGQFPHYLFLELPLYFLVPVLGHLLMTSGKRKISRLRGYGYLQLMPALLCTWVLLPVYSLDGEAKHAFASSAAVIPAVLKWLLAVQFLVYLIFLIRRIGPIGKRNGLSDSSRWWLIPGLGLFFIFYVLGLITPEYEFQTESAGILSLMVTGWFYKRAGDRVKRTEACSTEPGTLAMIEKVMVEEQLYLRKDLNLKQLAEKLGLSAHKLSHVLNHEAGTGYSDYVNGYRVDEVIRLLRAQTHKQYTLEAISGMAGFRSLTTFNTAFKKQTGQTPREFKI